MCGSTDKIVSARIGVHFQTIHLVKSFIENHTSWKGWKKQRPLHLVEQLVTFEPSKDANMHPCEQLGTLKQHVVPQTNGHCYEGVCQADRDRLGLRERSLGIASTTSSPGGRSQGLYMIPALVSTSASFAFSPGSISTGSMMSSKHCSRRCT